MRKIALRQFLLLLIFAVSFGCGFQQAPIPPVTPATVTLMAFAHQQFSVKPLPGGTIWSVNGVVGGDATSGKIDSTGLYTAPRSALADPVTITATSVAAPGLTSSATINLLNPEPKVASISPEIVTANGSAVPLRVKGTAFTTSSVVTADGKPLPTKYVDRSDLEVVVPAAPAGCTSVSIGVTTPRPGGGTAASIPLAVLSPGSSVVNVSSTVQFNALELPGGTQWSVNGQVGGGPLVGTISNTGTYQAPAVPPAAPVMITAASANNPAIAASAYVTVHNPVPVIASLDNNIFFVTSAALKIRVKGQGFVAQSAVFVGHSAVATTFVSSSELEASVPPSALALQTAADVSVVTPGPGGGTSSALPISLVYAGTVQPTAHPLVAEYDMNLPDGATMTIEFGPDQQYGRKTWTRPAPAGGGPLSVLVAGMKASVDYHMRARVDLRDGTSLYDSDHLFTTGDLPAGQFTQVTASKTGSAPAGAGVDLLSIPGSPQNWIAAVATDSDGNVIWYYDTLGAFPIREQSNGNFLVNTGTDVREVDLAGNILRRVTVDQLNSALADAGNSFRAVPSSAEPLPFHHDCLRLANGHWILLVSDTRDFQDLPGYPGTTTVSADALVDLDENNRPVWVWRAFDHLDVNRHPSWFPDLTHANAVISTPDGNLILSMRHQNWVIKIDYQNGKGTGNILWRLGPGGDIALSTNDPAQWFYNQHYPVLVSSNGSKLRLALYDNGDFRPDSTGTPCIFSNTCYSRGVILDVDEAARTADIVWQYAPGWFSAWGGSIVVLANGNVEIGSSSVNGLGRVVEVSPNASPSVLWQLDAASPLYRAYRIPSLYPGVQW